MQHIAYTEVEYVALDLETIFRAVEAKAPQQKQSQGTQGGSAEKNKDQADGVHGGAAEAPISMRTFDKVLFFKVLALVLSEKFQQMKQENIRSCNRLIQTDEQESLKEEIQKQELRLLCIRKFGLPDTDQVIYYYYCCSWILQ